MEKSRVIVVLGATGFLGRWIVHHLLHTSAAGSVEVVCLSRQRASRRCEGSLRLVEYNGAEHFGQVLREVSPDVIVDVTGNYSLKSRDKLFHENSEVPLLLKNSVATLGKQPRVIFTSTSAVYGAVENRFFISENSPIQEQTPYGEVKQRIEELYAEFCNKHGVDFCIARVFNVMGPFQSPILFPQVAIDSIRRIAAADGALRDLAQDFYLMTHYRDWLDVRDVASAMATFIMAERLVHPVYNVCSGQHVSIREITLRLAHHFNISIDSMQSSEGAGSVWSVTGDNSRLRSEFDWLPHVTWGESLIAQIQSAKEEHVAK